MTIGLLIGIFTLVPGILRLLIDGGYSYLLISFICLILLPIWYIRAKKSKNIDTFEEIDDLLKINEKIYVTVGIVSEIDSILDTLAKISGNIQIINKKIELERRSFYRNFEITEDMAKLLKTQVEYSLLVILDLRSDLATRLTEQQSALESAKSEVEQNITGTPELIAVSEMQKLRLDRQIEQFEELQRMLVRV